MNMRSVFCLVPLLLTTQLHAAKGGATFDEKSLGTLLAKPIIGPDLALAEVQVFNETRVPDMPRVRTAEEWQARADQMRREVLDKVVFRGGAAKWRKTKLKVEWFETIEGLPGYRIKKLRFDEREWSCTAGQGYSIQAGALH